MHEKEDAGDWDSIVLKSGCAIENDKLRDCYYAKRDWRQCRVEMDEFRKCVKMQDVGNREMDVTRADEN